MSLVVVPFSIASLAVAAAMLLVKVVALVDALLRPAAAYRASGKKTKRFWVGVLAVAVVLTPLGFGGLGLLGLAALVAAIVYLVDVRPRLRELPRGRSSPGPYGPW